MKSKNICKSIPISSADKLDTHQFIYETDVSVMNTQWKLKCNRIILVKSGSVIFNVDSYKISAEAGSIVFVFGGESFCPEAEKAFPGAVLPRRGRWMCCAGFPWAFGLPSRAAAQGNQPMISESLRHKEF